MKIVSLYVAFQGHDFVKASIDSIYNHVDKIVFAQSNIGWKGTPDKAKNTVFPVVKKWKEINDYADKIINIHGDWGDQLSHYNAGVEYIRKNIKCDYIHIIDTDEIYDDENLIKAKKYLIADNGKHDSFSCRINTYVKSPFYQVNPIEPCSPVVFLKASVQGVTGVRCNRVGNRQRWEDVKYHHMCYVRVNDEDIRRKFYSIQVADGHASANDWLTRIWDNINYKNLPYLKNLHPTIGAEKCWSSLIKINKSDMPIYLQRDPVLNNWDEKTGEKR